MEKYTKIIRHGKNNTHLIFEGNPHIVISEKLDGANASFKIDNGELKCFSRNTELDEHNTLRGFYNWVQETINPDLIAEGFTFYGEWLVRHKLDYGSNEGKFYLFDISNGENYLPFSFIKDESIRLNLNLVPIFYEGNFQSIEHIKSFVGKSELGKIGEGVVVKNYSYKDRNGDQLFTKFVSDDFAEKAKVKKHNVNDKRDSLDEFVETYLTKARVDKLLHKMVDENILEKDFDITDMGTILKHGGGRAYQDIIDEELDSLLKQVRKKVGSALPRVVKGILSES